MDTANTETRDQEHDWHQNKGLMSESIGDLIALENIGKLRARAIVELEALEAEKKAYIERAAHLYDSDIMAVKEKIANLENQSLQIVKEHTKDTKGKTIRTPIGKFTAKKMPDSITVDSTFSLKEFVGQLQDTQMDELQATDIIRSSTKTTYSFDKSTLKTLLNENYELDLSTLSLSPIQKTALINALSFVEGQEKCQIKYNSPEKEIAGLRILTFENEDRS